MHDATPGGPGNPRPFALLMAMGVAMAVAVVVARFAAGGMIDISIGGLFKLLIAVTLIKAIITTIFGGKQEVEAAPPQAEAAAPSREALERLVLQVALQNDGYVTPEALVLHGDGMTLRSARELLDDLAVAGSCEVDSDDEGHMHYRFRTSVSPARGSASPEQWLDQESRRMVGDQASGDTRLDA
ncbi:MAG: hypothetical protein HZB16_01585 [Armatimonadetes bacterium]|nr:hypothetical protein [Armatimonadota bacterium]